VVAAIVLDRDADIDAIGVFAAARLPNYMQPRFWVLDALPRSPNGKIDRPALRARHHSKQSTTSSGAMT
jgi:acyl-CoA synthetase (AMP-forming)/AMP-acid ligase II